MILMNKDENKDFNKILDMAKINLTDDEKDALDNTLNAVKKTVSETKL